MRRNWLRVCVVLLAAVVATAVIACGDDDGGGGDGDPTATAAAGGPTEPMVDGETSTVEINLLEWQVAADLESAVAGTVSFDTSNVGGANHELAVIRTDLAPDALPTIDDGSVDESGEGVELVGEVEELTPGDNETLELDLEAGAYVLICNLVDTSGSHYGLGMAVAFEVTG